MAPLPECRRTRSDMVAPTSRSASMISSSSRTSSVRILGGGALSLAKIILTVHCAQLEPVRHLRTSTSTRASPLPTKSSAKHSKIRLRRQLDCEAPVPYPSCIVLQLEQAEHPVDGLRGCRTSSRPTPFSAARAPLAPRTPPTLSAQNSRLNSDSVDIVLTVPAPAIRTIQQLHSSTAPQLHSSTAQTPQHTGHGSQQAYTRPVHHTPALTQSMQSTHCLEHSAVHAPQPGMRTRVTGHSRPVHTLCTAVLATAPQS